MTSPMDLTPHSFVMQMYRWYESSLAKKPDLFMIKSEVRFTGGEVLLSLPDRFISVAFDVRDDCIHCSCFLRRSGLDGTPESWSDTICLDRPKDYVPVVLDTPASSTKGRRRAPPTRASNDPEAAIALAQKLVEKAMTLDKSAWHQ
jgi:hypothetical protein